jgi:hypothetical protein
MNTNRLFCSASLSPVWRHEKNKKDTHFYIVLRFLFVNVGILFFCCFLLVSPCILTAGSVTIGVIYTNYTDQETNQFLKAKELVFKGEWNEARLKLEKYLVNFPNGNYRDEALYWLAKSLNKLANNEFILNKVISLKEEAAAQLDSLIRTYPESLWLDDGKTLRLSIAAELDMMGVYGHRKIMMEYMTNEQQSKKDSKNKQINALLEMRPEAAVTLVRRMLDYEKDPEKWKEAISILGQHFFGESEEFLEELLDHPYPKLREEAKRWIEWNEMWKIPTNLIYFAYGADISDTRELDRLSENKVNVFKLSRLTSLDKGIVEEKLNHFFNQKLKNIQFITNSTIKHHYLGLDISNNIKGFNFKILQGGLKKEYDKIHVNAQFCDNNEQKVYSYYTPVENKNEILLAMRKGEKLALVLLHFVEERITIHVETKTKVKPFYHSEFSSVLGCRILSTRQSWSSDELNKTGGVEDFGQAKAEIPVQQGTWILLGNIIVDRNKKQFIARNAELLNANGKRVAKGVQIMVPVENPEKFKIVGEK